jgi:hypothetical protein
VREGAKPKTSNVRRSLLINVVKFGLLEASNMAKGIRKESVNGVLTALII